MSFYAYAAPYTVVLSSPGDTLGVALMLSGFGVALVLGALALRDWRGCAPTVRTRALAPRVWKPGFGALPLSQGESR